MMGEFEKAATQFRTVLELQDETGELDRPSIQSAVELANVLFKNGKSQQAIDLLRVTHDKAEKLLGPRDMLTFGCRSNLASIAADLGDYEDAIPRFQVLLKEAETDVGKDHPVSINVRTNLAVCYQLRKSSRIGDRVIGAPIGHFEETGRRQAL